MRTIIYPIVLCICRSRCGIVRVIRATAQFDSNPFAGLTAGAPAGSIVLRNCHDWDSTDDESSAPFCQPFCIYLAVYRTGL